MRLFATMVTFALWSCGAIAQQPQPTQQQVAEDARRFGRERNPEVVTTTETAEPAGVVPGYEGDTRPEYDTYYRNPDSMDTAARAYINANPDSTAGYAYDQAQRPTLQFPPDDPLFSGATQILETSTAVGDTFSLGRTDCTNETVSQPETTIESCTQWTGIDNTTCSRTLTVQVTGPPPMVVRSDTAQIRAHIVNIASNRVSTATTVAADARQAVLTPPSGTQSIRGRPTPAWSATMADVFTLPANLDCSRVRAVTASCSATRREPWICSAAITGTCPTYAAALTFSYSDRHQGFDVIGNYRIDYEAPGDEPQTQESWTNSCVGSRCEANGPEVCTQGPETRSIVGPDGRTYQITRACWQYEVPSSCVGSGGPVDEPYCQELVSRGCTPLGQTCTDDGTCEARYECPIGGWNGIQQNCTNTNTTVGGIEFDTSYERSADFGVAAANLQAVQDAAEDMDTSNVNCIETPPGSGAYTCSGDITVFNTTQMSCDKAVASFSNCCSNSGWGQGWATSCSEPEEELRAAKRDGLCHYIGSFCSRSTLGICTERRLTFCCGTSKLGRIIHEQGRPQLGMDWGTARTPQCGGFTPEQLQAIDFSQIDFSEYFAEALNKISGTPDGAAIRAALDQYIQTLERP